MKAASFGLAVALLCSTVYAAGKKHTVTVGKGGQLKFDPESLTAEIGDEVTYTFFSKNHSVSQSSFDKPCQELKNGFFSGFTPTDSDSVAARTTFTIVVNATTPLWVYCAQTNGDHCQKGMVHAINAPSKGNTLDAYKKKAASASKSQSPANGLPVGGERVLSVDVGLDGLTFTPNNVTELVGTTVEFSFNPKNHTVSQSSFNKPCQPLAPGFSSGFVPTSVSPSGATFSIKLNDTKPVWYYCAQPNGSHCQQGMVGSINAPAQGNTFDAFKKLATTAPPSTIGPLAPVGGELIINGTCVQTTSVVKIPGWNSDYIKHVPKPGQDDQYMMSMAGGGTITEYGWGNRISNQATKSLQLLQWFDNILLEAFLEGYTKLDGGDWSGAWPKTIVDTIGSMAAQAYIHRSTATDTLQHYDKPLTEECEYQLSITSVDEFLDLILVLLSLQMGLLLDVVSTIAATDSWLVPALASTIGSVGRMTGVLNLMQDHMAAAAPREVSIPANFVYTYANHNYISSCPKRLEGWDASLRTLNVTSTVEKPGTTRVTQIQVDYKPGNKDPIWIAFIGPWGEVKYSPLSGNTASVPSDLYGHVWIVVTNKGDGLLKDLFDIALAGPAMLWISRP